MEKLWTTAEVAQYLGLAESDVEQLMKEGKLTGYKLGGRFLRFRPDQVKELQPSVKPRAAEGAAPEPPAGQWRARLRDFFYFYDLYVLSGALLAGLGLYLWSSGR